ncbi:MAG TPA: ABC transporter permease [Chthoniobacterales bacterium]
MAQSRQTAFGRARLQIAIALSQGLREMAGYRLRSAIAVLAIVLGVAAVLTTFALTEGVARKEWRMLQDIGGIERFSIVPAPVPVEQEELVDISPGLTSADVEAIRRECPSVRWIVPSHQIRPGPIVEYAEEQSWEARIYGSGPDLFYINRYELEHGRFLSDLDVSKKNRVCILGSAIAKRLGLTGKRAVRQKVMLNGVTFQVVGVLKPALEFWKNRDVVIPYPAMQSIFEEGQTNEAGEPAPNRRIREIKGSAVSPEAVQGAIRQMQLVLSRAHRGVEDFGFNTDQDWADAIGGRIRAIKISGLLIAGVSLLVGGIGVTNVMLAAIKQRVREIGVRRAIGARRGDVFVQIFLETMLLAAGGGILGIAVGYGLVWLLGAVTGGEIAPVILPGAVGISLAAAAVTGMFSGCFPAWKGSRLSPMEALHYE